MRISDWSSDVCSSDLASLPIGNSLTWRTDLDASYMLKYELKTDDGDVLRYDGTLSPCNITSCSGSPKWRASWQNTLEFGDTAVSLTAYYTRSEEHTSELQSLMRISYAVFCLKKKNTGEDD